MENTNQKNTQTIGVVHGGLSQERQKSLEYGRQVSKILQNLGMNVTEMHLHPNGSWTIDGNLENIEESIKKVDKVWNCLVGADGERGVVENLCEKCKVNMIGHTEMHSHLSANKKNLHLALAQHQIKFPHGKVILKKDYSKEKLLEIFSTVPVPAIVKPNTGSSMWGVLIVNNFTELEHAVEYLISQGEDVLVEKLIKGIPVSCFVFEHNNLWHTHIKVDGENNFSREELMNIRNEALYIHNVLAYKHHVEYDFIYTSKGLVFIETNTHPALTSGYISQVFKKGVVSLKDYIFSKI